MSIQFNDLCIKVHAHKLCINSANSTVKENMCIGFKTNCSLFLLIKKIVFEKQPFSAIQVLRSVIIAVWCSVPPTNRMSRRQCLCVVNSRVCRLLCLLLFDGLSAQSRKCCTMDGQTRLGLCLAILWTSTYYVLLVGALDEDPTPFNIYGK